MKLHLGQGRYHWTKWEGEGRRDVLENRGTYYKIWISEYFQTDFLIGHERMASSVNVE